MFNCLIVNRILHLDFIAVLLYWTIFDATGKFFKKSLFLF